MNRALAAVVAAVLVAPAGALADPTAQRALAAAKPRRTPAAAPARAPAPAPAPAPTPAATPADQYTNPVPLAGLDDLLASPTSTDLAALLQLAVRQSPALATASIDVEAAEAQIDQTLGLDDWQVAAALSASAATGSSAFGLFNFNHQYQGALSAGLSRPLSTGGTVGVEAKTDYTNNDPPLSGGPTTWTDQITASLTQPLLRGRGRHVARATQVEARLSRDAAELGRRQAAIDVVRGVVTQYWSLVAAEQAVAIAKASLGLAEERLRVTQLGVKGGKVADSELLAVEEAIATRQEDVINAEVAVIEQSVGLRRAVGMDIGPGNIGLATRVDLTVPARSWSLDDLLDRAMGSSPQLAQLATEEKNATLEIEVTENGLLPQLDLDLTLGPLGSDTTAARALKDMVKLGGVTVSGGLTYTQTLGNHAARGRTRAQRAARERIRVNAQDVRLQITQTMAQTVALIRAANQRVELATRAIALAKKNIVVEQARFDLGKSTNFDVLLRQDELRQAQLRLAQAQVDWHKAQAVIAALTGTILDDYGIALTSK
jgi:outer membrane protein